MCVCVCVLLLAILGELFLFFKCIGMALTSTSCGV